MSEVQERFDPIDKDDLLDLVLAVEAAIGVRKAGMTKIGAELTDICERHIRETRSQSGYGG